MRIGLEDITDEQIKSSTDKEIMNYLQDLDEMLELCEILFKESVPKYKNIEKRIYSIRGL